MKPIKEQNKELQELRTKADEVTDETLESTRRMVALCEETNEVGVKTIGILDEQGGKLDIIEADMDEIRGHMLEADKNLSEMEKCCGLCVLPWKKTTSFNSNDSVWKDTEQDGVVNSQPARTVPDRKGGSVPAPQTGFISKVTHDAREDEMDENMAQVSNLIGNLRNMAQDMESELDHQNQQLTRIEYKVNSNTQRIIDAKQRTDNLRN